MCGEGEGTVKKMGDAVTTRRERLEGECARVEATLKGAMDHNIHTRSSDGLGGAEIKVSRDPRVQSPACPFLCTYCSGFICDALIYRP